MDTLSRLLGRTIMFDDYCALALPRIAVWRVVCGLVMTFAVILALSAGILLLTELVAPELALRQAPDLSSTKGTLVALGSFIVWAPAIALTLWLWHRRTLPTLFNERRHVRAASYLKGFAIAAAVGLFTILLGALVVGAPVRAPLVEDWALLAGAAFLLLIIQTGSEELLFRGYLQQQLGARFRSGLWWGVLPSLMFGAMHWNPEGFGGGTGVVILTTGVFGLAMAVIVARTGDLSLVMGLHLGVNVVALLGVAPAKHLSGLSLFRWPEDQGAMMILSWLDFLVLVAVGLAALFLDQRRRNVSDLPDVFT